MARTYSFEPQGIIYVYRHVPLDSTYQHTLHFKTRADQLRYFNIAPHSPVTSSNEFMKLEFNGQTVTRNERKIIRVDHNYADLMDCNYIAYLNKPFASPNPANNLGIWVFAFIISVEYINDYVTEIEFEIDVMQTFMWNYALRECFVEREHSLTDNIGDSLTPEPLHGNMVERVGGVETHPTLFKENKIVFLTAFDHTDYNYYRAKNITGVIGVHDIITFDENDLTSIDQWLFQIPPAKLDDIYTCFTFPKSFAIYGFTTVFMTPSRPTRFDDYEPKNKKLFIYPYNYLAVDCGCNVGVYRYEFFDDPDNPEFGLRGVISLVPQVVCSPNNYNGFGLQNPCEQTIMDDFPVTNLAGSAARNWWAQHGVGAAITVGIGLGEVVAGAATDDIGLALGGLKTTTSPIGSLAAAINSPAIKRSTASKFSSTAMRTRDFYFKKMQITKESAIQVDNFFSMFGYSTQRVKVPNIVDYDTCRPSYNYLKCSNISVDWDIRPDGASVPHKYMKKIYEIYNSGITFWKNPNLVGHYEQPNNPPN